MKIERIRDIVAKLKRKYGDLTPEEMCDMLGIDVKYMPMGKRKRDCKGFFIRQSRIRKIVINSCLPRRIQRIILLHELAHAVLHGNESTEAMFHDFAVFDEAVIYEYEANMFAAEDALPDEDVLEALNDDASFFSAAKRLCVPPELLDFKFRILKRQGYALNAPIYSHSDFMKNIDRNDRF